LHGNFFIGNLDTFPIGANVSKVWKVTPSGQIKEWADGFSTVVGIAFDSRDRMYVLENTVGAPGPTPGAGRIVRVDPSGSTIPHAGRIFRSVPRFRRSNMFCNRRPGVLLT